MKTMCNMQEHSQTLKLNRNKTTIHTEDVSHPSHTPHKPLTHASHTPHTPLTHPSHTPHTSLTHPSHIPHTSLTHLHPSHTPHTPLTHPSHIPHTLLIHSSYPSLAHTPLTHPISQIKTEDFVSARVSKKYKPEQLANKILDAHNVLPRKDYTATELKLR